MWIKWLRRIEVGDMPWQTREETSKYTDVMADGKARRFTWVMDAKSVITNPRPDTALGEPCMTGCKTEAKVLFKAKRLNVTPEGESN